MGWRGRGSPGEAYYGSEAPTHDVSHLPHPVQVRSALSPGRGDARGPASSPGSSPTTLGWVQREAGVAAGSGEQRKEGTLLFIGSTFFNHLKSVELLTSVASVPVLKKQLSNEKGNVWAGTPQD